MTQKTKPHALSPDTAKNDIYQFPDTHSGQFCAIPHAGIVVEMEVKMGETADSQVIRKFISEFEQARKKLTV